jgi:hypothetical protein
MKLCQFLPYRVGEGSLERTVSATSAACSLSGGDRLDIAKGILR